MKILACYSNKGGVGKTASAVNLAHGFASKGYKTLLCDLDAQGAAGFYLQVKPAKKLQANNFFEDEERLLKSIRDTEIDNLDLLPANLSYRDFDVELEQLKKPHSRLNKALKAVKKDYEVVILDCPPTFSNLAESVFHAADQVLVPVIPTTLSERTLEQLYTFFGEKKFDRNKILPFFSMVQKAKALHTDTMTALKADNNRFCDAAIPFSTDVERMGVHRAPVASFSARGPAGTAYSALFEEIHARVMG